MTRAADENMRIITGRARGLRLIEPKNYDVRPTADRVKEALFSILGTRVIGARVLDLFAGTGNLGLECWSRGAARVTFVDLSAASLKLVRSNIAKCRAETDVEVLKGDAVAMLKRLAADRRVYDLLFCDPPYSKGWLAKVFKTLPQTRVLAPDGILVAEHDADLELPPLLPDELELLRAQKYGRTKLAFIGWRTDTNQAAERGTPSVITMRQDGDDSAAKKFTKNKGYSAFTSN